jgi:hypothetical protein
MIINVMPTHKTSLETSIWLHIHINPSTKYLSLHSSTTSMFIGNTYYFLTDKLPYSVYINNNASMYITHHMVGFYIFTMNSLNNDIQYYDNHYEYWHNNGIKIMSYNDINIKRTYWFDSC